MEGVSGIMLLLRVSTRHGLLRPAMIRTILKTSPSILSEQRSFSTAVDTKELDSLFDELVSDPARGLPSGLSEKMADVPIAKKWKWLSDYEVLVEQRKQEFDDLINDPEKLLSDETKAELQELPVKDKWGILVSEQKRATKKQEALDNIIDIHVYEADGTLKTVQGDVGKQTLFEAIVEGGVNIPHWVACNSSVTQDPTQQLEDWGDGPQCTYCSVHIGEEWMSKLVPQEWKELDLLWYMEDYRKNTRLSCQIPLEKDLDGVVVAVPQEMWFNDQGNEAVNMGDNPGSNLLEGLWENPMQLKNWNKNRKEDEIRAAVQGEELRFRIILQTLKK